MKTKLLLFGAAVVAALVIIWGYRRSSVPREISSAQPPVAQAGVVKEPAAAEAARPVPPQPNALSADRRAEIEEGVRFVYGRTVRGLRLTSDDEAKVWSFLIERTEAGYIARQVAREKAMGNNLPKLVAAAQQQVDDEARRTFPESLHNQLQLMVRAGLYLNELNQSYSRALASGGVPLEDSQMLPMAAAFLSTYGSPGNPTTDPKLAGVDANGLMPADHKLLERAAGVLSPQQLLVFEAELKNRNAKLLNAKN